MRKKMVMLVIFLNLLILQSFSAPSQEIKPVLWDSDDWSFNQLIVIPVNTDNENVRFQPVDTHIEFNNLCWARNEKEHSVRIVYSSGGGFREIESQIYDLEYSKNDYIKSCNIVFLIPSDADGTEQYFVFYDDEIKNSPDYRDYVDVEESYYYYEAIPGYPFEARYYKINQEGSPIYAVAHEGQSRGVGTSQQVSKLKKGTTDVKPQNAESVASFEFWYYYGPGVKDYSSTIQKFISSELLVDGDIMVEFEIVSGTPRQDVQTTVTYKYYYCPVEDKRIYAHVKHEVLKDCNVQAGENFDGVFVGIQTGGVKSSSIEEFNFGEIPPYLHVFTEQGIIQRYDVDPDPEYIPNEWNTPLLSTKDDVDLGISAWACFDNGEEGKAHSMILDSNNVIKTGADERDGVQLKAHESDYPHLPGFECDTASFYFGRNSYEKDSSHDLKIPKGLIIEFDAEFFSTENGGYRAVESEAEIFQALSKIRPVVEGGKSNNVAEIGEHCLTAYVHFASSVPFGSLLSLTLGRNIPYIYAELYKADGGFISSGNVNRLASSKKTSFDYDDVRFFNKITSFIQLFDWKNITFFKKIIFQNLLPGDYLVKIYKQNPFFGERRQFIGFQLVKVEGDKEVHVFCKPEACLQVSVVNHDEKEVKDADVLLMSDDVVIAKDVTDHRGTATVNAPYMSGESYLLKVVYKGVIICEEAVKLGLIRSFIPAEKKIKMHLHDFTLEIADTWGLYPEVELNPVLFSTDTGESVVLTGEQVSPGFFVFYSIPEGEYHFELAYKSFVFEKDIKIPFEAGFTLVFPVEYIVKTSVFDNRGDQLNNVKISIIRNGQKVEKTVDETGVTLFSLPPGTYNLSVYQNDDLIGMRKITIMDDRSIVLVTDSRSFYPLLVMVFVVLFAVLSFFYSYRKKDVVFFVKTVSICLIVVALVAPWWTMYGGDSSMQSTTSMFVNPVKMVTMTSTSDVVAGEFSSLPEELVDALSFIPVLTAVGCVLILCSMLLNWLNKKRFSLLFLFFAVVILAGSFVLFTYVTSQLTEIGLGGFVGSRNQYVSIPGENIELSLFCSWGPSFGFYLYLIAILLLIILIILGIKKLYRKRADLFWHCVELLCYKIDKLSYFYMKLIGDEYRKEIKVFDIGRSHRILHIGCGMYPISALTLADECDADIVTIDKRAEAVEISKQVVNNKKLRKKITVETGKGENYPMKDFDTIIISSCSVPKIKILENIFKNAKPGCKIIVREMLQERDLIIDYINECKNFLVAGEIDNRSFIIIKWKSFYLLKKD